MADPIREALARLEQALAGALERVTVIGTPAEIERLVRLIIKHKIVMELLLDKIETATLLNTDTGGEALSMVTANGLSPASLDAITETNHVNPAESPPAT
ncbi:hypothetical protein HPT25_05125 [Bacillus sp. BRMEA1]|uniref:hypothetical protein n=1 Tax=Neobacillus endophyticus TaxID=2738405 RepID=UPI00156780BE|nr:hypothetical protein [Neobacillus endophyticus]NRD76874.1 hypothetical protein [Neobacillus endophyticus]